MAIAITATGCKSKSTPKTADSVAVEEADTLVTDSFSYHSEQDSTVYSTLRIDYPQGEGSLPMAVRKFIAHELSQLSLTATCTEEGNKKTADYSGSLDKAQQLVDFYGKCNMDFLVSMQKEVYEGMSGQKPEYAPRFNNELSLKKHTNVSNISPMQSLATPTWEEHTDRLSTIMSISTKLLASL